MSDDEKEEQVLDALDSSLFQEYRIYKRHGVVTVSPEKQLFTKKGAQALQKPSSKHSLKSKDDALLDENDGYDGGKAPTLPFSGRPQTAPGRLRAKMFTSSEDVDPGLSPAAQPQARVKIAREMLLTAPQRAYLQKHELDTTFFEALQLVLTAMPEQPKKELAVLLYPEGVQQISELTTALQVQKEEVSKRVLYLAHFNDVYHIQPMSEVDPVGGAARFSTKLEKLVADKNPLILFSGDFMGPSKESSLTRGRHMVECLNYLNVKFGVFGNHEFDYGYKKLMNYVQCTASEKEDSFTGMEMTWLMSNMREKGTQKPLGGAEPYAITTWSGVKVGLLGLCEDWLSSCPRLEASQFEYLDIFETGQKLALELKEQGLPHHMVIRHSIQFP